MKNLFIAIFILLTEHQAISQISKYPVDIPKGFYAIKGDYYFDHQNYVSAIGNYNQSLNLNHQDVYAMLRMAEAYNLSGDDEKAIQWYANALRINPAVNAKYILKYISVLLQNNKYDELTEWMKYYNDALSKRASHENKILTDTTFVFLKNLKSINSNKSDISPVWYKNRLYFSSDRSDTNEGNYDIYASVISSAKNYEEPKLLPQGINSSMSEGPIAITQKQGRLFFTRAVPLKSNKKSLPQIVSSNFPESNEAKIDKLKISFKTGMGQPSINSEGTLMIFVSNNLKSKSGYDLYKSELNGSKWSDPVALSSSINSNGDEMYPSLYNDSILYFASNGRKGLGGLDVYKVNIAKANAVVEHLPAPINSPHNDFGFILSNTNDGYLTSDRPGGLGKDDLYKLHIMPVKILKQKDNSVEEENFKPGDVSVYTSAGDDYKLSNNSKGNLKFDFIPGVRYSLIVEYDNHKAGTIKPANNKMNLLNRNNYTFHVQQMIEASEGGGFLDMRVNGYHVNPGDLVTFLLTPNRAVGADLTNSKIRFQNNEAVIKHQDTVVFSYVAEGSVIPDENQTQQIAAVNSVKENNDSKNKVSDTPVTAKKNQPTIAADTLTTKNKVIAEEKNKVNVDEKVTTALTDQPKITLEKKTSPSDSLTKNSLVSQDSPKTIPINANALQKNVSEQNQSDKNKIPVPNTVITKADVPSGDQLQNSNKKADSSVVKNYSPSDSLSGSKIVAKEEQAKTLVKDNPENAKLPEQNLSNQNKISEPDKVITNAEVTSKAQLQNTSIKTDSSITKNPTPSDSLNKTSLAKKEEQVKSVVKDNPQNAVVSQIKKPIAQTIPAEVKTDQVQRTNLTPNPVSSLPLDKNSMGEFRYRVQIAASHSELSSDELKKIYQGPLEILSFNEEGYHKYYIKETNNYRSALQSLKASGVNNAFIAAYKGNTKMNLLEAIYAQKKEGTKISDEVSKVQDTTISSTSLVKENNNGKVTEPNNLNKTEPTILPDQKVLLSSGKNNEIQKVKQISDSLQLLPSSTTAPMQNKNNGIKYRVQIAASPVEMSKTELKKVYSGPLEIYFTKENEYIKYYVGETSNYYEARKILNDSHVGHSFITAHEGDIKLKPESAIASQYKKPQVRSELAKTDSVVKIVIVNFNFDEYTLLPKEKVRLQENVVEQLKSNNEYRAVVNGYTDARGTEEYNFGLSQERAYFVEQLIVADGIAADRVATQYFGESQLIKYCPENQNCDESIHQANRRVEVLLIINKK